MPNSESHHYPQSYYAATANGIQSLPRLQGRVESDVCIVGGGFTGISTALHLSELGFKAVLLEANRIGWGASGRNGGQLHSGQRRDQPWLEKRYGLDLARQLWQLAEEAKSTVLGLIDRYHIRCDWKSGLIHAMHKPQFVEEDHELVEHMRTVYGCDFFEKLDRAELEAAIGTDSFFGGSRDASAGHLHPLNLALGMARGGIGLGASLFEDSRVTELHIDGKPRIKTEHGEVTANAVVLAGNGYMSKLNRGMDGHILPINNYIVATETLEEECLQSLIPGREAVCDSRFVVNYWRTTADRRLLFGGGETYSRRFPSNISEFVRPHLLKIYPRLKNTRIEHAWGGTLAVTPNRLPYFNREGTALYIAAGFSGQGVALANFAGKCIAEAVSGDLKKFDTFANLNVPRFPGGAVLRSPILALAMTWFAIRDRI